MTTAPGRARRSSGRKPRQGDGLLLALLLAALSSCASLGAAGRPPAFALLSSTEDFARLGLDPRAVAPWEDGRRSDRDPSSYEWWYFDALLDDGTVVVAWFGDNWGVGTWTRNVSLEVTPPGEATRRYYRAYAEAGGFARDRALVRIGPHSFAAEPPSYRIVVAPEGGLGIDLLLEPTLPPWRPATGIVASGRGRFAWLAAVPDGRVSGSLTVDGRAREVAGSGYHDHNWGNGSPADLMDSWWWARARVGGRTAIVAELRASAAAGGARGALFYLGGSDGLEVDGWAPGRVSVAEGPPVAHPDPLHPGPIASSVTFTTTTGESIVFRLPDRALSSVGILADRGWFIALLACAAGLEPWYSRFESPVVLTLADGTRLEGRGTLEFIEFRPFRAAWEPSPPRLDSREPGP